MLQAFQTLNFPDQQVNRLQDNIAAVLAKLAGPSGIPFLDGVSVRVALANGANVVSHKLGRKPQGWFLTRKDAAVHVYETNAAPFTATSILLTASASVNVTIWIF